MFTGLTMFSQPSLDILNDAVINGIPNNEGARYNVRESREGVTLTAEQHALVQTVFRLHNEGVPYPTIRDNLAEAQRNSDAQRIIDVKKRKYSTGAILSTVVLVISLIALAAILSCATAFTLPVLVAVGSAAAFIAISGFCTMGFSVARATV